MGLPSFGARWSVRVQDGGAAGQVDQERGQCDGDGHGGDGDQYGAHRVAPQAMHTWMARQTSHSMGWPQQDGGAMWVVRNQVVVMPHSPPRQVWGFPGPGPPPGSAGVRAGLPGFAGRRPPGVGPGPSRAGWRVRPCGGWPAPSPPARRSRLRSARGIRCWGSHASLGQVPDGRYDRSRTFVSPFQMDVQSPPGVAARAGSFRVWGSASYQRSPSCPRGYFFLVFLSSFFGVLRDLSSTFLPLTTVFLNVFVPP